MLLDERDIIADILKRIAAATKVTAKMLASIEKEVRADWGGERCYIAKTNGETAAEMSLRNACIRRDYRRGAHEDLLARRHGVSVARIRQIIRSEVL